MGNFLRILLGLTVWLPLTALNAWAVGKLWNWYIPQTFGLDNILFAEAVGIALIVTYMTYQWPVKTKDKSEEEMWGNLLTGMIQSVAKPLICVGAGWVYLWIWPLGG